VLGLIGEASRATTEAFPRRRPRQLFGETLCLAARPHILHTTMSDKPVAPPAEPATSATIENVPTKAAAAAPKPLPEQNAAFRMMGRLIASRGSDHALLLQQD
jgi:hypothetical protein